MKLNKTLNLGIIAIFFVISIHLNIASESLIELQKINSNEDLGRYVEVFEDASNTLDINDILEKDLNKKFISSTQEIPNYGFSSSTYWIKLKIFSSEIAKSTWLLELNTPNIEFAQLYTLINDNNFTVQDSGIKIHFSKSAIPYPSRIFILDINEKQTRSFYLKLKTNMPIILPIKVWQEEKLIRFGHDEQMIWGIYYGILTVAIFYNLLLYLSIRDKSYLFYVTYLIPYFLFQISYNGLGHQYFESIFFKWGNYSINFFASLSCIGGILFVRSFLDTASNYKKWDRFLLCQIFPFLFVVIVNSPEILIDEFWIFPVTAGLVWVPILSFLIIGIYLVTKKHPFARYFLFAWISLLVGTSLLLLKDFGLLPLNVLTKHGTQLGLSVEVILLSLAIAQRVNAEKKSKEKALSLQIEESQKVARLTDSFKKYVPVEFLELLEKKSILDVNPGDHQSKHLTVLFSDIRSFTSISESMSAQETFHFINSYLNLMEPCITKNNGFIDKYIGDAILSLFKGSPSDAIQTAIEMNLELSKFNTMMDSPIRIGVGIHAGQMLLGTVGSETRIDGTVAGNEIKVAMQIEELTKKFGVKILISETVKKNLYEKNNYSMRYLGKISIHGLAQELPLYEILNCDSEKIFNLKVETKENFETAVGLLAEWKFSDAKAIFQSILQKNPDDLTANYFLEECNLILRK